MKRAAVPVVKEGRLSEIGQRKTRLFDIRLIPDPLACSGISTACIDFVDVPSPTETNDICFWCLIDRTKPLITTLLASSGPLSRRCAIEELCAAERVWTCRHWLETNFKRQLRNNLDFGWTMVPPSSCSSSNSIGRSPKYAAVGDRHTMSALEFVVIVWGRREELACSEASRCAWYRSGCGDLSLGLEVRWRSEGWSAASPGQYCDNCVVWCWGGRELRGLIIRER